MFSTNALKLLSAALLLVCACAVAGCGNGAPYGDGGFTGSGGSGGGSCSAIQGSCRNGTGLFCSEYAGVPAATLTTLMEQCTADPDEPGTWSSSGCTHAGAVGGCSDMQAGACVAVWLYVGTAAQAMESCAEQGGSWINP